MKYTFDLSKRLSTLAMSGEGSLQHLASWIIDNQNTVADLSLSAVSKEVRVSETTVFRIAKRLGFDGYRDMRVALAELRGVAKGQMLKDEYEKQAGEDPYSVIAKNTVNVHSSILRTTARLVDPTELRKSVRAIQSAAIVHVLGFGSSAAPAMDIYQRLIRFGYAACIYDDPHVLTAVTSNPPVGSVFFAISFSGQSRDVVDVLRSTCEQSIGSVLVTSNTEGAANQYADIVLTSAPSGSLVGSESVASRVSQLAIIDMICTGLALEHPKKNEFLRNANVIEEEIEMKRVGPPYTAPALYQLKR